MPKPPEMTHSSSFWGCIKPIGLRAFKVAFCDLEACSSARAGRGNKMRTLAVHPVNTMYARYFAEMLGVVSDYGQSKMTSRVHSGTEPSVCFPIGLASCWHTQGKV